MARKRRFANSPEGGEQGLDFHSRDSAIWADRREDRNLDESGTGACRCDCARRLSAGREERSSGNPGSYHVPVLGEKSYLFRHALLRDAAYQLQLPGDRVRLHALAFRLIEALFGGRPAEAPLDETGARRFQPHSTDGFARELAGHSGLAATDTTLETAGAERQAMLEAQRQYLRRSAEHTEIRCENVLAAELWQEHAGLVTGVERCESLRRAAVVALESGRPGTAEPLLERALADSRDAGLPGAEVAVLVSLGLLYRETSRYAEAERCCERALAMARQAGLGRREGAALGNLALLYRDTGRAGLAERGHEQALTIHRRMGNRRSEGIELGNLATVYRETGRIELAERTHELALAIHRDLGNRRFEGLALGNLANVYAQSGRMELAQRNYMRALAINREVGNRRNEGVVVGNLADLNRQLGRHEQAERNYEEALAIHREVGNRRFEGITLGYMAGLFQESGRGMQAEDCYERALVILRDTGDRQPEGVVLGNLASLYRDTGRLDTAARLYEEALAIHRQVGSRRFEGQHLCGYALLLISLHRNGEARETWLEGTTLLLKEGDTSFLERKSSEMRAACKAAGVNPFDETPA